MKTVATKFFTYGENEASKLNLLSGEQLGPVQLAYETHGQLNQNRDNAILVFHTLTGSQHLAGYTPDVPNLDVEWNDFCQTGWWDKLVGPGKAIDTEKYFVICINYLGGCYGTTGPSSLRPATDKHYGGDFPKIEFSDIVNSQIPLLNHLGIEKLYACMGPSLGGMLAIDLAARYPERVERVLPISCGLKATTLTRAHNLEQILAIENDPNFNDGHYYRDAPPLRGLALARMISHKTFVSLQHIQDRAHDKCEQEKDEFSWYKITTPLESYILHQGRKFLPRFDPNSYLYLIQAWQTFNLLKSSGYRNYSELFSRCRDQKYLVCSIDGDVCFYPEEQEDICQKLRSGGVSVKQISVSSNKGHDAFLVEQELFGPHIKSFLEGE